MIFTGTRGWFGGTDEVHFQIEIQNTSSGRQPNLKRLPTTFVSPFPFPLPQVFCPSLLGSPNTSDETVAAILGAKVHMQRGMTVYGAIQP